MSQNIDNHSLPLPEQNCDCNCPKHSLRDEFSEYQSLSLDLEHELENDNNSLENEVQNLSKKAEKLEEDKAFQADRIEKLQLREKEFVKNNTSLMDKNISLSQQLIQQKLTIRKLEQENDALTKTQRIQKAKLRLAEQRYNDCLEQKSMADMWNEELQERNQLLARDLKESEFENVDLYQIANLSLVPLDPPTKIDVTGYTESPADDIQNHSNYNTKSRINPPTDLPTDPMRLSAPSTPVEQEPEIESLCRDIEQETENESLCTDIETPTQFALDQTSTNAILKRKRDNNAASPRSQENTISRVAKFEHPKRIRKHSPFMKKREILGEIASNRIAQLQSTMSTE